jgi:AAA+ ATPase superfamily predicted ATPase
MRLPFLNREAEQARIERALDSDEGALVCLYGRRRVGKSRLVCHLLRNRQAVYYVGDDRDAALQRASLAREIARVLSGFDRVTYPDWEPLLDRWWSEAPRGAILALDEFPALVSSAPELPSLLQKCIDQADHGKHVLLTGSSQRMMQGLLLDASAPLYGRAREMIRLEPLAIGWLKKALRLRGDRDAVEHWAAWGGVPRYWELAADHRDLWSGVGELLLDPLGVLHDEPHRLLLDDLHEIARATSILALVGQGCHRVSEIGGRLGVPSTSLSRPISRLMELGLLARDQPYGSPRRSARKTLYTVSEPLLRFWFRFVEPNRSRLAAGQRRAVLSTIQRAWPPYMGQVWVDLARASVATLKVDGRTWRPASRWWGPGTDRRPMELDIVADCADDPQVVLVGEAKSGCRPAEVRPLLAKLEHKASRCPPLRDKIIVPTLWILELEGRTSNPRVLRVKDVIRAL